MVEGNAVADRRYPQVFQLFRTPSRREPIIQSGRWTSALVRISDSSRTSRHFRKVPKADIRQTKTPANAPEFCRREVRAQTSAYAFRFLRHQPSRPAPANIRPGRPAPTMGPGTGAATAEMLRLPANSLLTLLGSGRAVLKGGFDFMSLTPPSRWVGGVQIGARMPDWRWDYETREAVRLSS